MANSALFQELRKFLAEIDLEKSGSKREKRAASSEVGKSEHVSDDVDNNTVEAEEGSRAEENESDVKDQIPSSVNEADESSDEQEDVQMGTATATGEDPAVEDDYKSDKEDPGTEHPATTEDGEKYGAYNHKPFSWLYKKSGQLADDILAAIAAATIAANPNAADTLFPEESAQIKSALAGQLYAQHLLQKEASTNAYVQESLENILSNAESAADQTAEYLNSYRQWIDSLAMQEAYEKAALANYINGLSQLTKAALEDLEEEEEDEEEEAEEEEVEGDDEEGDDAGDNDEAALREAETALAGGPVGGSPDDAVDQLLMAMMEMGVTPDQLQQSIADVPPERLAEAPMEVRASYGPLRKGLDIKRNLMKLAEVAKKKFRQEIKNGTFRYRRAKTAQEKLLRAEIQRCLRDIIGV